MFGKRVISSIVLVAIALLVIIPGGFYLAGMTLFLALVAFRELFKCCKLDGKRGLEIIGYIGIVIYYAVMVFVNDRNYLLVTIIAILMAFMFMYVFTFPKYEAKDIMMGLFCVIYAPLMLSFIYMTRSLPYGAYAVWFIFVSSWISDTAAYCVGMLIGKHKLAPVLSPKKSIEGALGGVCGSAIVGALLAHFLISPVMDNKDVTLIFMVIAAVGSVISQVGDLAASGIKRNQGIKDYGKLIPGHGGVMDRFDSVIFTAPIVYFLTLLLIR